MLKLQISKNASGFSLIEAMVATAIVGIGFAGIFTFAALSEQFMKWSIGRQKLQLYADQMLQVIEGDVANIASYNMGLTTCVNPGGSASTALTRQYEWCVRMSNEFGPAGTTDVRTITVTNSGTKNVVVIRLEAYKAKSQVIMERSYGS